MSDNLRAQRFRPERQEAQGAKVGSRLRFEREGEKMHKILLYANGTTQKCQTGPAFHKKDQRRKTVDKPSRYLKRS